VVELARHVAATAVIGRREDVGLAFDLEVRIAFLLAPSAKNDAAHGRLVADAARAIERGQAGGPWRAAVAASATISPCLVAVLEVVVTRGPGADFFVANEAVTVRRLDADLPHGARLAIAAAVGVRLRIVLREVVAAWLLAIALDALTLPAIAVLETALPELAVPTVDATAVEGGLPELRLEQVVLAVLDLVRFDEVVIRRTGRDGCESDQARKTSGS
jgi:hypothetical protein